MLKKVIAITGPTASGKSAVALELCKRIGGEIVSCDSMQVYKGMDVGTAKPTAQEQSAVRHHMIDVVSPDVNYSCADYVDQAKLCIDDIISRGRIPVVCGGTGMYFERMFTTAQMESPPSDPQLRRELESRSAEENYAELALIDPESAAQTHMNNRKRVIRALEIYRCSGRTKTEWDRDSRASPPEYDLRHFTLVAGDRAYLYARIDQRVDSMLENGLEEEVRSLSLSPDSTAAQAIGYKEFIEYFGGGYRSLDEVAEAIKQNSRNYAKRQITWFKRYKDAVKIDICSSTCEIIVNFIRTLVDDRIM